MTPASRTLRSPAPLFPPQTRPGRRAAVRAPLWGQPPPGSPRRANFPSDNRSGLPRGLRRVGAPLASVKPTENMAPSNVVPRAPKCRSPGPSRSPPARNLSSWASGKETRGRRVGSKPCPRSRLSPRAVGGQQSAGGEMAGKGRNRATRRSQESGRWEAARGVFRREPGRETCLQSGAGSRSSQCWNEAALPSANSVGSGGPAGVQGEPRGRPGRFSDPVTGNPRRETRREPAA